MICHIYLLTAHGIFLKKLSTSSNMESKLRAFDIDFCENEDPDCTMSADFQMEDLFREIDQFREERKKEKVELKQFSFQSKTFSYSEEIQEELSFNARVTK